MRSQRLEYLAGHGLLTPTIIIQDPTYSTRVSPSTMTGRRTALRALTATLRFSNAHNTLRATDTTESALVHQVLGGRTAPSQSADHWHLVKIGHLEMEANVFVKKVGRA